MSNAKHRADCSCAPCTSQRVGEARRQLEAEAVATYRAVARALVAMCARMANGALSGPDVLRRLAGDDADLVLRAAGIDPAPLGARRRDLAPAQQSTHQSRTAAMWQASPDHDLRVVKAIVSGASDAELSAVRQHVAAEYASQAADRQERSSVMWRTRKGIPVRDGSPAVPGIPVQRSRVSHDVPELGSEPA